MYEHVYGEKGLSQVYEQISDYEPEYMVFYMVGRYGTEMGRVIYSHVSEMTNHILIRDKQNIFKDVVMTLFQMQVPMICP